MAKNEQAAETQPKADDAFIITCPCRLSYLNAFAPKGNKNDPDAPKKYGVTLLIPKASVPQCPTPLPFIEELKKKILAVGAAKFGDAKYQKPLKDGDFVKEGEEIPPYPGFWYIKASSQFQPVLVNGDKTPAHEADGWVSGDWGRAKLALKGTEYDKIKRVTAYLQAIQFTAKDEPFGGGGGSGNVAEVAEEFGSVSGYVAPTRYEPAADDEHDPFRED